MQPLGDKQAWQPIQRPVNMCLLRAAAGRADDVHCEPGQGAAEGADAHQAVPPRGHVQQHRGYGGNLLHTRATLLSPPPPPACSAVQCPPPVSGLLPPSSKSDLSMSGRLISHLVSSLSFSLSPCCIYPWPCFAIRISILMRRARFAGAREPAHVHHEHHHPLPSANGL
jgi:hypothetical protein